MFFFLRFLFSSSVSFPLSLFIYLFNSSVFFSAYRFLFKAGFCIYGSYLCRFHISSVLNYADSYLNAVSYFNPVLTSARFKFNPIIILCRFLLHAGSFLCRLLITPVLTYAGSYFMPVYIWLVFIPWRSLFMPFLISCRFLCFMSVLILCVGLVFSGGGTARRPEAGGVHRVLPNGMHSAARWSWGRIWLVNGRSGRQHGWTSPGTLFLYSTYCSIYF